VGVVRDLFLQHPQLGLELGRVELHGDQVREHALYGEVLLDRFMQQIGRLIRHHPWVEQLLLDGRVGRELVRELGEHCLAIAAVTFELFEQRVDLGVLFGEKIEGIQELG
jgi:hypothetical protein